MLKTLIILCNLLFVTLYCQDSPNITASEQLNIKILLEEKLDGILLETDGEYKIIDIKDNSIISRASKNERHYLSSCENGIKWGKEFARIFQCKLVAKDNQSTFLLDGIQYKGSLEIYLINNKLYLINEVNIEDYIVSSLSKEFALNNFYPSTYESLAIIARTKIYHKLMHNKNKFFTFKANTQDFLGYSYSLINSPIEKAAKATKDLLLTYKNKPFNACWTSHCSGQTAKYSAIMRKNTPSPDGVLVAYSQKEKLKSKYQFTLSKVDFCKYLGIQSLKKINLFHDSASKKVYAVQISSGKKTINLPFLTFQKLIGKSDLKSNDFTITSKKDDLIFQGYGSGLGIGLCIFSADEMASRKENSPRILKYFYPQTNLIKISDIAEDLNKPLNNLALSQIFEEEIFD